MVGLQGRVFAGYQLAAQIGTGGIAEVYRGRAPTGGREVAVKIIHPDFAREPGFHARFQQSVQTATRLGNHPHVLPLLASGEENGYYFLVTPFVADGTLRDWLQRGGRLGVGDVAPFFRQIVNGLAYAHSMGAVHGNLKPANVFLFEGRHVLLGDFGLLWDITQLDMQHAGPGTEAVEFFAPEAFGGRTAQASDIYGLGAILFATLTGHAPFRGQTPADVYSGHANKPVPPLTQFDPTLPPALRALDPLIARAMAKRPEDRFPSATLVAQLLETALQQAGGSALQPPGGSWAGGGAGPASQLGGMGGPASQFPAGFGAAGDPSRFPGFGGVPGGLGAAAPAGAPLQPLNFPPLPSSEEANGLMEQGHIAANWNDASVQQTQRVPADAMMPPGTMMPPGGMNGGGMPYPGAPMAPTTGRPMGMPMGAPIGMPPGPPPAAAPPIMIPGLGSFQLPSPNSFGPSSFGTGGPLSQGPLSQLPEEAPRELKGYSATELGLPRLTAVDMGGGLPPDVQQQIIEQIGAQAGAPVGVPVGAQVAGSEEGMGSVSAVQTAGDAGQEWDESRAYTAARGRYADEDSRESEAFSAAYAAPRSEWDYSEEMSAEVRTRRPAPRRASLRGRERWDEDESVEVPQPRGGRSRRNSRRSSRRDDYEDEAGYDRYDRRPRGERRRERDAYEAYDEYVPPAAGAPPWLRPALLAVIAVLLLTMGGVAVLKPDLCPISVCASVSAKVHHVLGIGNDANAAAPVSPLSASPAQIQLSTTAGIAVSTPLKLTNTSAASVDWKATTDLQWVTFTPANGTVAAGESGTVTVQAKPTGIAPGTYAATILVTTGATTLKVPLQVAVAAG